MQEQNFSNTPYQGKTPTINPKVEKDDPGSGSYDFGPRVGKVTGLKISGRPATREEALKILQQSASGLPEAISGAQNDRVKDLEGFTKSHETDTFLKDTMRDILPMAMFPMMARGGFVKGTLGGAAAGAVGGQVGETMDRATGTEVPKGDFVDWLSRRGEDAAMGGMTELGGRAAGGLLRLGGRVPRRILGGALQDTPQTLRENVAGGHGIHFTPSQVLDEFSGATSKPAGTIIRGEESRAFHNPYSRSIAQSGARVRNQASKATVTGLINHLGPDVPSNITGQRMASIIQSVGKPTWQRQVEKLKSIVNAKSLGTLVDTAPLRDAAKADLEELEHKLIGLGQVDDTGRPILPQTAKVKMLMEVLNYPDHMPFSTLASKRTDWMGVSPQITELISGEVKGTAKHFTEISTDLLNKAAKGADPDPFEIKTPPMSAAASKLHSDAFTEAIKGGSDGVGERAEAIRKARASSLIAEYANEVRNAAAGVDPTGQFIKDPTERITRATAALQKIQKAKEGLIRAGVTANDMKGALPPQEQATLEKAQGMLRSVFSKDIPTTRRGFEQEWNRFRNFTRKGADVFESQVITDAVNNNPEDMLKLVKGDDITDALRIRRAIKSYGQTYGDTADRVKAEAAWRKFQVGYLRENVLGQLDGNMTHLQDTLEKMTPAVKKVIFDDPQSQQTLLRLTQVGKALKDADKNLGVLMGHQDPLADLNSQKGWLRSIRPYVVAKIAWNPTATRFFLRGLAGLAEAPPTDSKIKDFVTQTLIGKGSKVALKGGGMITNRRLGAAMADVIRAYDLVNIYDEAKRQEKKADEYIQKANQPQGGGSTTVPATQP